MQKIHRTDIDGLRAIAIIGVLIFHFYHNTLSGGYLGVDIFFVISGFLITDILLKEHSQKFNFIDFISKRIIRLVPALIIVLSLSLIVGWFIFSPENYMKLGKHVNAGAGFFSNFVYLKEVGYFDADAESKVLLHLWSLGVEGQFYIVWALIFWGLSKLKLKLSITTIFLFFLTLFIYKSRLVNKPSNAFYLPDSRMWEILFGALIAEICFYQSEINSLFIRGAGKIQGIALLAVIIPLFLTSKNLTLSFALSISAVIGSGLVLLNHSRKNVFSRILSNIFFQFIGKISYPLYLFHWVVLTYAIAYLNEEPSTELSLILIIISIFFAWLTYRYIEKPLRFTGNQSKKMQLIKVVFLLILLLSVGLIGKYIWVNKGIGNRQGYSIESAAWVGVNQDDFNWSKYVRSGICHIQSTTGESFDKSCIEQGEKKLVILWGDSYASSLYPGLLKLQSSSHLAFRLGQLTTAGCPPLIEVIETEHRKNCSIINKIVIQKIRETQPDTLIIHAKWSDPKNNLSVERELKYLENTILFVKKVPKSPKIILIGPIPTWTQDLPQILASKVRDDATHSSPPPMRLNEKLEPNLRAIDDNLSKLSSKMGVVYYSPLSALCNENGCITRVGDKPTDSINFDRGHLSKSGSEYLINQLRLAY